jgi:hypothetical protein
VQLYEQDLRLQAQHVAPLAHLHASIGQVIQFESESGFPSSALLPQHWRLDSCGILTHSHPLPRMAAFSCAIEQGDSEAASNTAAVPKKPD